MKGQNCFQGGCRVPALCANDYWRSGFLMNTTPLLDYGLRSSANRPGNGSAYLAFGSLLSAMFVYAFLADLMGSFGNIVRPAAIIITLIFALSGVMICFARGMIFSGSVTLLSLFSVWLYLFIFSQNAQLEFTWSGGEYVGISLFSVMALTIRDRSFERVMLWFYYACCGYAAFYVVLSLALKAGLLDVAGTSRILTGADDAGRSDRLNCAAAAIIFGLTYSVAHLVRTPRLHYYLITVLFCLVWYLTSSRAISAVLIVVIVAYVFSRNVKLMGRWSFLAFVAGTIFSVALMYWPEFNPFIRFYDQSALVRINSISIASTSMSDFWLFGAGIAFGEDGYKPLSGITYFFPSDIGMIGHLYVYGVFGLALYCLVCYYGCRSFYYAARLGYSAILAEALALTGIVFALYSLQSPQYNGGSSGSVFAMMYGALALSSALKPTTRITPRKGQAKAQVHGATRRRLA
jgi:hypothetical protein